jgi:hypothetical protein
MAVPASEEARQPTIRNRRLQWRIRPISVLYGHFFNGFHKGVRPQGDVMLTPLSGSWSGLWASGALGNSRRAEKGAS